MAGRVYIRAQSYAVEKALPLATLADTGQTGAGEHLTASLEAHLWHATAQCGVPGNFDPEVIGARQFEYHHDVCPRFRPDRDAGLFQRGECD